MPLDPDAARTALAGLAGPFGLDELDLAHGILTLATVKMTSAIKEISVACGHDPRDFVLMPFGGAGPMHATDLADELGIRRVLVPPVPGNFSALGFVTAQARHDYVRTVLVPADDDGLAAVRAALADLRDAALAQLKAEDDVEPDQVSFGLSVGMRFRGQSFDLAVALPELPATADELVAAFHAAYAERYAYTRSDHPAEIVNCRLTAFGPRPAVRFAAPTGGPAQPGRTRLYRPGGWVEATVWRRADLGPGCAVVGPAVVRENGSTTVVGGGWAATVDDHGNLLLTKE